MREVDELFQQLIAGNYQFNASIELEDTVDALLKKYPYAASLHWAKLAILKKNDSIHFSDGLKHSALHINNRGKLYTVLQEIEEALAKTSKPVNEPAAIHSEYNIEDEFKESKAKSAFDLIDEFLVSNPKISPRSQTIQEQNFEESLLQDDNLVSETLAKIFIKQNRINDAIAMYQKLQLKDPTKSSYFARQIAELEKKTN
ncbi:MAG: hypothetical protein KDC92_08290 [Bacteroidetes bacterium]|nr:hypothetical protein [Bacteroidota bacterium]